MLSHSILVGRNWYRRLFEPCPEFHARFLHALSRRDASDADADRDRFVRLILDDAQDEDVPQALGQQSDQRRSVAVPISCGGGVPPPGGGAAAAGGAPGPRGDTR